MRQEATRAAKNLRHQLDNDDDPYSGDGTEDSQAEDPNFPFDEEGEARARPGRLSSLRGTRGRRQPGAVRCSRVGRIAATRV